MGVFFSSLSQKLEESLKTELSLARMDLVEARKAKSTAETDRNELAAARDQLKAEIADLDGRLSSLRSERQNYAQAARSVSDARYTAMVRYELELLSKIAEIASVYDKTLEWVEHQRDLKQAEAAWNALPDNQKFSENPFTVRYNELRKRELKQPEAWFGIPKEPDFNPIYSSNPIVWTAFEVKIMNGSDDPDAFDKLTANWLSDRIRERSGATRSVTVTEFMLKTKKYSFLGSLLPEERKSFDKIIDGFFQAFPGLKDVAIGVSVPTNATTKQIVTTGQRQLATMKDFRKKLLGYLTESGIIRAEMDAKR